jgi:signal transduction histidine kinase
MADQDSGGRTVLEETLRRRTADLQVSQERLSAFARTLSEDVRGPLGLIVSFAQLLEEDYASLSDEELHRYLRIIVQRGREMVDVIDALLMVPSEPPREVEEEMAPLDTAAIVADVLGRLDYMVIERGAQIVLPDSWPKALGHAPWVEEIWVNLLNNAIKYGGNPPLVELGAEKEGGAVRFWVRDNGPGLAPEEQVRLFAPGDRSQISEYGLGLDLVRRVVGRIGGDVGVESEVGQGSLFYFTLPAAL